MRCLHRLLQASVGAIVLGAIALPSTRALSTPARSTPAGQRSTFTAVPVATGLNDPTAFSVAPDGTIFYVERVTGNVHIFDPAGPTDTLIFTIPHARSLDGMALNPNFAATPYVYVWGRRVFHGSVKKDQLLRFTDSDGTGTSLKVLFSTAGGVMHYGGVIKFGSDGMLYFYNGDEGNAANAQDLSSPDGKLLRVTPTGKIPSDNPFPGSPVWAYGLRNSMGMVFDPITGGLWEPDNGTSCNDEVNLIIEGGNYGWGPSATCKTPPRPPKNSNQDGHHPILPKWWSLETFGPTGAAFCSGCRLGIDVEGNLLFGNYEDGEVLMATLNAKRDDITGVSILYSQGSPVLSIETGPDGTIYFSTGGPAFEPGAIYKLEAS